MLVLTESAILVLLLYGLFVYNLASWHRLGGPPGRALRWGVLGVMGGPLVVLVVVDYWHQLREYSGVVTPALQALLFRASSVLPQNLWIIMAIAAVPVLAMSGVLVLQFASLEFTSAASPAAK